MATPVNIYDVAAIDASKVLAALLFPSGLVAGAASTVSGGQLSGASAITAGATVVYLPLVESPAGNFGGEFSLAGTVLPNTTNLPYTVQAKVVAGGTDMVNSNQTTFAAAYAAANTADAIVYTRDVPPAMVDGRLTAEVWGTSGSGLTAQQARDAMLLTPTGVADTDSIDEKIDGIVAGGGASVEDILAALAGVSVRVIRSYVNGDIEIRKGDSYDIASSQRITIIKPAGANWPIDLTTWTLTFTAAKRLDNNASGTATLTVTVAHGEETGAGQSFHIDLTAAQTTALALDWWTYDVQAANGVLRNTLISGNMRVLPELTTA